MVFMHQFKDINGSPEFKTGVIYGVGSLKVTDYFTIWYSTFNFTFTIHGNYVLMLYYFQDMKSVSKDTMSWWLYEMFSHSIP